MSPGFTVEVSDGGRELRITHPGKDGERGIDATVALTDAHRLELIERLGGAEPTSDSSVAEFRREAYEAGYSQAVEVIRVAASFTGNRMLAQLAKTAERSRDELAERYSRKPRVQPSGETDGD